jgi:polysaccharide pyruvyl transferase WcaK-like protein
MSSVTTQKNTPPRILLVGYNGANNTGSEARLLAIINDIRKICGLKAEIIIPTLNKKNLLRFVKETEYLKIISIPTLFFLVMKKIIGKCDLVLLVEGSCYMDTWTNALLWAFLYTTRLAFKQKKPCLAYAVDAGSLSPANRARVKHCASKTSLIITRSYSAKERLEKIGVTAPMTTTADNAFCYEMNPRDRDIISQVWPEAATRLVGMALVDFYRWPVVLRAWGDKRDCYQWPYYFSSSKTRREQSSQLALRYAREADRIIETYNRYLALICMESLDEPFVKQVYSLLVNKEKARIFSSRCHDVSQLSGILNNLEFLISSRYHACVLSMQEAIPLIGIGHDFRIRELFKEIGIYHSFFIDYTHNGHNGLLSEKVDLVMKNKKELKHTILNAYRQLKERAERNPLLLKDFISKHGWRTVA